MTDGSPSLPVKSHKLGASQRRILLHDVKKVYKHFCDRLKELKANEGPILSKLQNEPLFLNVDDDEESLNWVKGTSLAIGCNIREGSIQGVRASLYNLEEILEAAGAITVRHPNVQERDKKHSESRNPRMIGGDLSNHRYGRLAPRSE